MRQICPVRVLVPEEATLGSDCDSGGTIDYGANEMRGNSGKDQITDKHGPDTILGEPE